MVTVSYTILRQSRKVSLWANSNIFTGFAVKQQIFWLTNYDATSYIGYIGYFVKAHKEDALKC